MPAAVTAGPVAIRHVFDGGVWSVVGLVRLKSGVTASQYLDALHSGNEARTRLLGVSLGAVGSPAGARLVSVLAPGEYLLGDVEQTGKNTYIVAGRGFSVLPVAGPTRLSPVAAVSVGMVN